MEPVIAFRVLEHERLAVEVRVNFGVLTGRQVTAAEIDDLAHALRDIVPSFEIVAEERHEFGDDREVALHQVVIETADGRDEVGMLVIGAAERWAMACYEARHIEI